MRGIQEGPELGDPQPIKPPKSAVVFGWIHLAAILAVMFIICWRVVEAAPVPDNAPWFDYAPSPYMTRTFTFHGETEPGAEPQPADVPCNNGQWATCLAQCRKASERDLIAAFCAQSDDGNDLQCRCLYSSIGPGPRFASIPVVTW